MIPLTIKFQAYIPKSLGKPLLSYFEGHRHFNPREMTNYEAFRRALQECDSHGYTWLPEPGNSMSHCYFATDNVHFHDHHRNHSTRLNVHLELDLTKTGNLGIADRIFKHESHREWGGNGSQHSDESHRVRAYIAPNDYMDSGSPFLGTDGRYKGICEKYRPLRSDENPLKTRIENRKQQAFSAGENDTTIVTVSASAGYPFTEPFSPNIDFELKIEVYKHLSHRQIAVYISGEHNDFPTYELIVGHRVAYTYNPSNFGYTGPSYGNLNKSRRFHATEWIRLQDWDIRKMQDRRNPYKRYPGN